MFESIVQEFPRTRQDAGGFLGSGLPARIFVVGSVSFQVDQVPAKDVFPQKSFFHLTSALARVMVKSALIDSSLSTKVVASG